MDRLSRASLVVRFVVTVAILAPVLGVALAAFFVIGAIAAALPFGVVPPERVAALLPGVEGVHLIFPTMFCGGVLLTVLVVRSARGTAEDYHARALKRATVLEGVGEELQSTVARLSREVDVEPPVVEVVRTEDPLSYAVWHGGDPTLVVSTGLVDVLDDAQLEAVLAHEVAHFANRDVRLASWALVPLLVAEGLREQGGARGRLIYRTFGGLLVALAAGAVALFARGRELAADSAAARLTGDPVALATALETLDDEVETRPTADLRSETRVVNVLSILPADESTDRWLPDGVGVFDSHPSTGRRIDRLQGMARDLES